MGLLGDILATLDRWDEWKDIKIAPVRISELDPT